MAWASGQRLQGGKYTIEQELGEGGFGITYRANNNNGRQVVIKTLNDRVQRRPNFAKFQQDFLNEALRLAKCSHPHIVRIDEVIQEGQLWCMVMEYIDGEDLASRVENQGALAEAEALRYIQQIGEALTVVHNNGLLHRDIKPQNIMLRSGKSEAVLIDFGIAREFTPNLTQTHTQYFSDGFAPIEQYDKQGKRGAYTDIYALAATLYSLLTGEVPTLAPLQAIGTPLEPPQQINPNISNRVNQAILKGMEVKAENRPQSVQAWLRLLKDHSVAPAILKPIPAPHQPVNPSPLPSVSHQSTQQLPPPPCQVQLISAVRADYCKLRDLLAASKWKEADEETAKQMLKVARRKKEGFLGNGDIDRFPCEDLRTIDQLWVKYSNGRFGFSVQKRIYKSLGGTQNYDDKIRDSLGDCVGWRVNNSWLSMSKLTFAINAPLGHLPYLYIFGSSGQGTLFCRVEACRL